MTNKNLSVAKNALLEKWLRGQLKVETPHIPKRPPNTAAQLSFPQQRQLFLELLERGTAVNNLSVLLELKGEIDLAALEKSANRIIARHEILRTKFSFGQGLPTPEVLIDSTINIPIVDLEQFDIAQQETEARRLSEKDVLEPFDLAQAPLIRLKLFQLSSKKYSLLVTIHHTIADGWSLGVFLRELIIFYRQITEYLPVQLPKLPIQYADFAYWQNDQTKTEGLQTSKAYWKKQLGGELPVLELPTDQQRGTKQTFAGGTYRFTISRKLTEALEKISGEEDATLFMTLLTAFYVLLHRYSGQDEIVVGTPVANRNFAEIENLIGVFINTLVLRTSISGDPGFRQLLGRVRGVSLEAFAHQDLPFEKLVEELKPQRDLSRTPLFQVMFNLQNSPLPKLEIPGVEIGFLEVDRGVSQFDLTLIMSKSEGQYYATVEYNEDLFKSATVARMFQSFLLLLEEATAHPDQPVSRLQLISKEEKDRLIYGLNQTQMDFPCEKCIQQLFEEQVEQTPNTVAVIYNNNTITYFELNRRANLLAEHLQAMGSGLANRVGILMEKSLETIIALFAVLKSGGTYVPIHNSFPEERVQFILKDANIRVLLTDTDSVQPGDHQVDLINLKDEQFFSEADCPNPPVNTSPDNLAYIMYTSGSTGQPKGVMVAHSALVNFLWSMRQRPGIEKGDVLLSLTSISFDIAALELFLPLIVGATIVIAGKEMNANPVMIGEAIKLYQVNIMQATPATWQLLLDAGWAGEPGLKALCGGEALTRTLSDRLLDRVGNLWNMYGPTETTVWSSVGLVQKDANPITIGKPIGNTQLYILDRTLQSLPVGVLGELHIGGEGLAQGYLNHSILTGEKFIQDPFHSNAGARLFKTGDLARYLEDGSIEILGRMDDQVKINGHRIELGEVNAVLVQHPSVQEAIVIVRKESNGDKRLVAYFVPKHNPAPIAGELRDFISKKLPAYMIPAFFISLDSLPLSPNGKIDRKALPVPGDIQQLAGYVAPGNDKEQLLAEIWQNALGVQQVGIYDNFFDLGGASIQSLEIVAKANISGLPITVESIFQYQTIAGMAAQIK